MKTDSLKQYIDELNKQYKTGIAREHSYRPALKDLLQSLLPKMVVTRTCPFRVWCARLHHSKRERPLAGILCGSKRRERQRSGRTQQKWT